jgi:hypothetical protein
VPNAQTEMITPLLPLVARSLLWVPIGRHPFFACSSQNSTRGVKNGTLILEWNFGTRGRLYSAIFKELQC